MALLNKKVAGLGLVLLGGIAVAHGGATGLIWETVLGLFGVTIGTALLVMKVVHRNVPDPG